MDSKVTILLATHNRSHLIGQTLDSIRAQTYGNWECLIVDDHSTDRTDEVIKQYQEKDSRFFYFLKTTDYRKGLSGTRNQGLDLAKERGAEFIQFFDDDDIMHPQKLELKIKPFSENDALDLTICCYRKFEKKETIEFDLEKADDRSCNIITNNLLKSFFLNQIDLNSPGPLWRAGILHKYRFNEDLFYAEEREFYLRIFLNEELAYKPVNRILFWYRKHPKAITSGLYKNENKKILSLKLFDELLFNESLRKEKVPFFILKSFAGKALEENDKIAIKKLILYLRKNGRLQKPRNFKLFLILSISSLVKSF